MLARLYPARQPEGAPGVPARGFIRGGRCGTAALGCAPHAGQPRAAVPPAAGVVSIELLLLMPFFALLLFSVYLLGDLMLVQQKTELAARYVAWKQHAVNASDVRTGFFPGQTERNQIQTIEVEQGSADRRYPKAGGDNAEQSESGALRTPPRFLYEPLSGVYHSETAHKTAHIAYEGNTGGGNQAAGQSYFGTDQPASAGGGGWTMEQWGSVITHYAPMGYTTLALEMGAAHKVLMGRYYYTEIAGGGGWHALGSRFKFRQAAVEAPSQTGIADPHDDVNCTSWEYSGLMKELFPQP